MKEEESEKRNCRSMALWMVLVGTLAGFFYSVVILFVMPKKYESSAIVEFRKGPESLAEADWSPANEVALITSPKLLKEVNRELNLGARWSMEADDVVITLGEIMEVESVGESDLQKITIRHASPDDAKEIAGEIPWSYLRMKRDERVGEMKLKQRNLETLILRRADKVEHAERLLRKLLGEAGLDLLSGDQLKRSSLVDFYESNSVKSAEQAVGLEQYETAWRDYASQDDLLGVLVKERTMAVLDEAEPYVPLKVHGESVRAKSAAFPDFEAGLWWGLLKGVIFGFVLGLVTLLFFKMKKGEERLVPNSDSVEAW